MRQGFSLVELSIVLVILGLLVGGILGGQSLIRAAEIRHITTDIDAYKTAINTFRLKYFALPGDMKNATDFWGEVPGCPTQNKGTGTQTCNGNGDGILTNTSGNHLERLRSWQHLSNAQLIAGQYTGAKAGTYIYEPGISVPKGPFSDTGYSMVAFGPGALGYGGATGYTWGTDSCNYGFFFGGKDWDGMLKPNALTPAETWSIDQKLDDGEASEGMIRTGPRTSACVTSSTLPTAYALDNDDTVCMLTYCVMHQ